MRAKLGNKSHLRNQALRDVTQLVYDATITATDVGITSDVSMGY